MKSAGNAWTLNDYVSFVKAWQRLQQDKRSLEINHLTALQEERQLKELKEREREWRRLHPHNHHLLALAIQIAGLTSVGILIMRDFWGWLDSKQARPNATTATPPRSNTTTPEQRSNDIIPIYLTRGEVSDGTTRSVWVPRLSQSVPVRIPPYAQTGERFPILGCGDFVKIAGIVHNRT